MSRYLGEIERRILEELDHNPHQLTAPELTYWRFMSKYTQTDVRRALHSLEISGLIKRVPYKRSGARSIWTLTKAGVRQIRPREWKVRQDYTANRDTNWRQRDEELATDGAEKKKLAKLLGLLGSDHDGEVLTAAKAVEAQRERLGKTWEAILGVDEME